MKLMFVYCCACKGKIIWLIYGKKPYFELWLSGVGSPVHGYVQKNPHSCKDTKMATPLAFCRGMS